MKTSESIAFTWGSTLTERAMALAIVLSRMLTARISVL